MNQSNRYLLGFILVVAAYVTLIAPEVNNHIQAMLGGSSSNLQANRYSEFLSLVIIAFLIHKRYIPDPEQLNQQRFKCAAQMREPL
ncbi:hypothetical protein [Microcystis aeruginosa]|uniref:hypothetical protein n=1 Tax=Microcystis aeruginosa TaxID=1126 RepID=UPI00232C761B|nr:hypothetical protein [Microcystis aeruginosa]MDB9414398.1 hypothetical protein [Microcystis aeruginosa CS-567/02]